MTISSSFGFSFVTYANQENDKVLGREEGTRSVAFSCLSIAIDPNFTDDANTFVDFSINEKPATDKRSSKSASGRSYDFISVEEAEEKLKKQRTRHEKERSNLQRLIDVQNQQIRDLSSRSRKDKKDEDISKPSKSSMTRIIVPDFDGDVININGKGGFRKNKKRGNARGYYNKEKKRKDDKRNANDDDIMARMKYMEERFRQAVIDNKELSKRLQVQRRQYLEEREGLENQIRNEQDKLNCVRDELHMERAYFETSRRMLERLLEDEQRKVEELEQEILMLLTREQIFYSEQRIQEHNVEQQSHQNEEGQYRRRQQPIKQNDDPFVVNIPVKNRNRRAPSTTPNGFTMNINDVHCPLFP